MPIYKGNEKILKFEQVEDYADYSAMIKRVIQIYSSDEEVTKETTAQDVFVNNGYSSSQPEDSANARFDSNYRGLDVKYKSGSGFLIKNKKLVTSIENIQTLLQIPARLQEEYEKLDFIRSAIESGKLWCYRDYDHQDIQVSSIDDYSFDNDWAKLGLSSRFKFEEDDEEEELILSDDYFPIKTGQKIQMFGYPLGSRAVYRSVGYIYNLMPKYKDANENTPYKYGESVLSFLPGSSGSPVFNSQGIFLGICTETDRSDHFTEASSNRYEITEVTVEENQTDSEANNFLKVVFRHRLKI